MFQKPRPLTAGDTVAVVSPSWGGPSIYPQVYQRGIANLQNLLGVKVKEFPTAMMAEESLYLNPRLRAEDINSAFADPEVKAIFATIGGDDSIRILPYLDLDTIRANPKILMGYSDTTTLTSYLNQQGLITFSGPAIMAGFAQLDHFPGDWAVHLKSFLTGGETRYQPFQFWIEKYVDWGTMPYLGDVEALRPNEDRWQWLQGSGRTEGTLYGGNIEVLEFMKGTDFWPRLDFGTTRSSSSKPARKSRP